MVGCCTFIAASVSAEGVASLIITDEAATFAIRIRDRGQSMKGTTYATQLMQIPKL